MVSTAHIDSLRAPLMVSWQLTRGCNLACLHCCTESAPGKVLEGELNRAEALRFAARLIEADVPYVMLCGGEPFTVEWFLDVASRLGKSGVQLKIETNAQHLEGFALDVLARLPVRSIQVSLDGASQTAYGAQRAGGDLEKALDSCRRIRAAGLPLEITFAPTVYNIHEGEAVLRRAVELGAFRFNTGRLMRIGTAAKFWDKLDPPERHWHEFLEILEQAEREFSGEIELCYRPFTIQEGLREGLSAPPATLLVLPHGKVKVAASLPYICADVRRQSIAECWDAYRAAWRRPEVHKAIEAVLKDPGFLEEANCWRPLDEEEQSVPISRT
ncbi:MAG: radical SAM protein [Elusimicrobiota bacterium]